MEDDAHPERLVWFDVKGEGDYPLGAQEATDLANALHAFYQEGEPERTAARKIERRLVGDTDTPVRLDDSETVVVWRVMDKPRLIDSERWRELYNAFSRSQGLKEVDITRYA